MRREINIGRYKSKEISERKFDEYDDKYEMGNEKRLKKKCPRKDFLWRRILRNIRNSGRSSRTNEIYVPHACCKVR